MLGVNIGDLCCDNPWVPKHCLKKLNTDLREVESIKFFHANPSIVIPFGVSKKIKNFYIHLSNPELISTKIWKKWVKTHVKPICNRLVGKNIFLVVGNEVLADYNIGKYGPKLLPAMRSCQRALYDCGIGHVKIVTPLDTSCLQESYPPSASRFKPELVPILKEIISFMVSSGSKLTFNIYPYFAKQHVTKEFALFGNDPGYLDKGKSYTDLFSAQYDSVIHAVTKLGVRSSTRLELVVTETGWPSQGGDMASPENTSRYLEGIKNICNHGTPLRRGPKEILVFELYDENLKTGPDFEKYFGIFNHRGQGKK